MVYFLPKFSAFMTMPLIADGRWKLEDGSWEIIDKINHFYAFE
jgi:hypothetical protein